MNTKTLKKYNNALNELKQPLNETFKVLLEIGCYTLPLPITDDKIKMIIFDKGKEIKKKPVYSKDEFKIKQIEFLNYFYNKYIYNT